MPTPATATSSRQERPPAAQATSPGNPHSAPAGREPAAASDWQRIMSAIDERMAGFEARLEQATAEFEAVALARLQRSFGEVIGQAQVRIKRYAEACGESRLVELEAELEQRLGPFLNRAQAAIAELGRLPESIQLEPRSREARARPEDRREGIGEAPDPIDLRLRQMSESLRREGRRRERAVGAWTDNA